MEGSSTIFLIGFMGSGKTTFGKKLAAKLLLPLVDLDQEVILHYQSQEENVHSIKEIIGQNGLPYFRAIESETLRLIDVNNKVISTGGGTPCHFDNMDWMKRRGVVIFLQVDEGVLFSRLKNTDLEERPLLKDLDEEGLKSFIHEKLLERLPIYSQAHITFNPVTQKIEDLMEMLK
jgi:shikimate kinase